MSFTTSLRAARRTTASHPGFPPDTLADGSHTVTDEILTELLPTRTHRANPRVIKRKMYVYQVKHPPPPRSNTDPLATHDQHRLK